jgi:hypothetical protein
VGLRVVRRVELHQPLELEPAPVEELNQLSRRQVKLDLAGVGPLDPTQPALRALEVFGRTFEALTESDDRRVPEEDEPATCPQKPGRLGNPAIWIRPDRRSVLRNREVEG